jgi:flagellar biosynthesis protein FlhF
VRVKSFYGNSIKEALDKARRELGPDAAIVASRQIRPEEGRGCEVVCGVPEAEVEPTTAPATVPPQRASAARRGVTRIRKSIEALVGDDGFGSAEVRAELLSAGFGTELADEIVAGVRQRQREGIEAQPALIEELSSRLALAPQLGTGRTDCRIVALVGPPGAGKTTTLVKLAVRYGLTGRKPLHIVSMDSWRIGGTDALRTYAAGMGVTFDSCETAATLAQTLEQHSGKGLILIDTPGMGPNDVKAHGSLASMLSGHAGAEVQLVVPATMSPASMSSLAKRFQAFLPSKLIVTCADCVDSCLPAVGLAITLEKPVSFVATGQAIPEDIEEASAARLLPASQARRQKKAATSAA